MPERRHYLCIDLDRSEAVLMARVELYSASSVLVIGVMLREQGENK